MNKEDVDKVRQQLADSKQKYAELLAKTGGKTDIGNVAAKWNALIQSDGYKALQQLIESKQMSADQLQTFRRTQPEAFKAEYKKALDLIVARKNL